MEAVGHDPDLDSHGMTVQGPRQRGSLARRLAFIALWLLAEGVGATAILVAFFFSVWTLPAWGMEGDLSGRMVLYTLYATMPFMALTMVASLVFAVLGRRRAALLVLLPGYCLAATPFIFAGA